MSRFGQSLATGLELGMRYQQMQAAQREREMMRDLRERELAQRQAVQDAQIALGNKRFDQDVSEFDQRKQYQNWQMRIGDDRAKMDRDRYEYETADPTPAMEAMGAFGSVPGDGTGLLGSYANQFKIPDTIAADQGPGTRYQSMIDRESFKALPRRDQIAVLQQERANRAKERAKQEESQKRLAEIKTLPPGKMRDYLEAKAITGIGLQEYAKFADAEDFNDNLPTYEAELQKRYQKYPGVSDAILQESKYAGRRLSPSEQKTLLSTMYPGGGGLSAPPTKTMPFIRTPEYIAAENEYKRASDAVQRYESRTINPRPDDEGYKRLLDAEQTAFARLQTTILQGGSTDVPQTTTAPPQPTERDVQVYRAAVQEFQRRTGRAPARGSGDGATVSAIAREILGSSGVAIDAPKQTQDPAQAQQPQAHQVGRQSEFTRLMLAEFQRLHGRNPDQNGGDQQELIRISQELAKAMGVNDGR